jgi:hypothetical protein
MGHAVTRSTLLAGAAMPITDGMSRAYDGCDLRDPNTPESWNCIDCGRDTAPGVSGRSVMAEEIRTAGVSTATFHNDCEVYAVRDHVWKRAGMGSHAGCLCIGCLETRLGRRLKPKDFPDNPLNWLPGTLRLMNRQGRSA